MNKILVKIEKINIGLYETDSVVVNVDNVKTEICFSKKDNISQYQNKEVWLTYKGGKYIIQEKEKPRKVK